MCFCSPEARVEVDLIDPSSPDVDAESVKTPDFCNNIFTLGNMEIPDFNAGVNHVEIPDFGSGHWEMYKFLIVTLENGEIPGFDVGKWGNS